MPITEEIVYFTVYSDINDVEGIVFEGYDGTEWSFKANGNEASPKEKLLGRPIGFRAWIGDGGIPNQPLKVAIVYNGCNCPASYFIDSVAPADMTIEAVVGSPVKQNLPYQKNLIETIYTQNCGSYSITMEPSLLLLEFSSS